MKGMEECSCIHNYEAVQRDIKDEGKVLSKNMNVTAHQGQRLVKLEKGEKILDFFNCAYKSSILIQGHIYVTNRRVFFFSFFNDKDFASFVGTFFGMGEDSQTVVQIMLEDVEFIYKCKNAVIFDNSIGIRKKKSIR